MKKRLQVSVPVDQWQEVSDLLNAAIKLAATTGESVAECLCLVIEITKACEKKL